jgi:uncharacterized protein
MTDFNLARMTKAYPTLKQSFFYLFIMLMLNIMISLVIIGIAAIGSSQLTQSSITLLVVYVLVFVLAILYGWRRIKRENPEEKLLRLKKTWVGVFAISMVPTFALLFMLDPIVNLIPMPDWLYRIFAQLLGEQSLSTFIMLCVAAPILEELIFRGIILQGFLKNYSPQKAIIWSSVLFGLVHLNPWQFIPAVLLGIFIGWIYWKSRSILPCIFIHFVANSSSYFSSFFIDIESTKNLTTQELIGNNILYFSLLLLSLFLIIASVKLLNFHFSKNEKQFLN